MMYRLADSIASAAARGIAAGHPHEDLLEIPGGEIGSRRELGKRSVGDDPAVVHDDDARADLFDEMQQMRREQDRRAGAAARDDRLTHFADADRIEPRQRLVEEQRRGIPDR